MLLYFNREPFLASGGEIDPFISNEVSQLENVPGDSVAQSPQQHLPNYEPQPPINNHENRRVVEDFKEQAEPDLNLTMNDREGSLHSENNDIRFEKDQSDVDDRQVIPQPTNHCQDVIGNNGDFNANSDDESMIPMKRNNWNVESWRSDEANLGTSESSDSVADLIGNGKSSDENIKGNMEEDEVFSFENVKKDDSDIDDNDDSDSYEHDRRNSPTRMPSFSDRMQHEKKRGRFF